MAASILTRLLAYSSLVVMVCSFTRVHGRAIQLNWTADGVRDYTSTPLRVELGDTLELACRNISNLFIQRDRIQYDSCNASAGSGAFDYNGFCFSGSSLMLTLRENSQDLDNTVNFGNNQVYFLTSYSEGSFRANDATFTSGGQCEDGLKMIFVIGQAPVPTVDGGGDDSGGNQHDGTRPPSSLNNEGLNATPSGTTGINLPIIAGAVAGGVVLVAGLLIMIIIIIVCVKKGYCSRETRMKHSTAYYGNSSITGPGCYTENMYNNESDSQGSKPVIEVRVQETTQRSQDNISLQTFGQKSISVDHLNENPHKSAGRGFDDATGQSSTPFHVNPTPEHLLNKVQWTSENLVFSGKPKPKPLPLPKPRQNNMYKSSSADNLIS